MASAPKRGSGARVDGLDTANPRRTLPVLIAETAQRFGDRLPCSPMRKAHLRASTRALTATRTGRWTGLRQGHTSACSWETGRVRGDLAWLDPGGCVVALLNSTPCRGNRSRLCGRGGAARDHRRRGASRRSRSTNRCQDLGPRQPRPQATPASTRGRASRSRHAPARPEHPAIPRSSSTPSVRRVGESARVRHAASCNGASGSRA